MNYPFKNKSLRRSLSLSLVLLLTLAMLSGCSLLPGSGNTEPTTEATEPSSDIPNIVDTEPSTEPSTVPTTVPTTAPKENMAVVKEQLNIRSSPSTEATVVGTLFAGDKVEISRRESVTGIDWAYIISPEAGWIVMDFVEMDIPTEDEPKEDTSTPAGSNEGNTAP